MPWLTLSGSNYPCLERISMVPKMFEPLRFDCKLTVWWYLNQYLLPTVFDLITTHTPILKRTLKQFYSPCTFFYFFIKADVIGIHFNYIENMFPVCPHLGPVVQSVVSLTGSLRVISLTILVDITIQYSDIFCWKNVSSFCSCTAKATHIFSAKNFSIFAYHLM